MVNLVLLLEFICFSCGATSVCICFWLQQWVKMLKKPQIKVKKKLSELGKPPNKQNENEIFTLYGEVNYVGRIKFDFFACSYKANDLRRFFWKLDKLKIF